MSSFKISSVTLAVDKATSELLLTPDWAMDIEICDFVNSHHWQTKDVVKAVKKRLQHKDPNVQLLALTLLETLVKNCGQYVHLPIAENRILGEMIKIVRKKADMQVRTKILVLLDSWQEAFGEAGGKSSHYSWAYEELRRSGIQFPPPANHLSLRNSSSGYGIPSTSFRRLDEAMATEIESLSLSSLESMRNLADLLNDMVHAVNPADHLGIKDEVIVDLIDQSRSNQKKLIQMLTTTRDEEILARGLELNDIMQIVLARHDATASGIPLTWQTANTISKPTDIDLKSAQVKESSPEPSSPALATVASTIRSETDETQDEDGFAQLVTGHSKTQSGPSEANSTEKNEGDVPIDKARASHTQSVSEHTQGNDLALTRQPEPVRTSTKEQDIIDLLSITLSTNLTTPSTSDQENIHLTAVSSSTNVVPHASQSYPGSQEQFLSSSYIVPWAQHHQLPIQFQPELYTESQSQLPNHTPTQPQCSKFSYGCYPPPPWAASQGTMNNNSIDYKIYPWNTGVSETSLSKQMKQPERYLAHSNSFPVRGSNNGSAMTSGTPSNNAFTVGGQKPFVPPYRLFEDLNVYWNVDGRDKVSNNPSPSILESPGESMICGRK